MSVSSVFDSIEEIFKGGDPEIRTWFLVRNNYLPLILSTMYVLSVKVIIPYLMKDRQPFQLRLPLIIYNMLLLGIYIVFGGNSMYILIYKYQKSLCGPLAISREDGSYEMMSFIWIYYMLKYVQYSDTIFSALRKKDKLISNLHVTHHAALPIITWSVLRVENSGFFAYPAMINTMVHIVMYAYYGLAAFGPKMRKYLWWKRYVTILQMVQFATIVFLVTIVLPLSGCSSRKSSVNIMIIENIFFLILFYNFYQKTFKPKSSKKANAD